MMTHFKWQVETQITQKAVTKEAVLLANKSTEQHQSPWINLVLRSGPLPIL